MICSIESSMHDNDDASMTIGEDDDHHNDNHDDDVRQRKERQWQRCSSHIDMRCGMNLKCEPYKAMGWDEQMSEKKNQRVPHFKERKKDLNRCQQRKSQRVSHFIEREKDFVSSL